MSGSNAAVEGLSGALGGVLALLTTYPLMTVRHHTLLFCTSLPQPDSKNAQSYGISCQSPYILQHSQHQQMAVRACKWDIMIAGVVSH